MLLDRMMMVNPTSRLFVEDVFSTWLYTGNGSTQTITNGINLSGQGGLVWIKGRDTVTQHALTDTVRGTGSYLSSDAAIGPQPFTGVSAFLANGFSLGSDGVANASNRLYASWTFREAPNFFDVVTYTGNGVAGRTIPHNLGVAPGCIIIKSLANFTEWQVYHRSTGATTFLVLNSTAAQVTGNTDRWNATAPTASVFSVGNSSEVNTNGATYVAYLFAHVPGSDGIIQCGSFTGAGTTVNLGWEPQWLLMKQASESGGWFLVDNMRGFPVASSSTQTLFANTSAAEGTFNIAQPTSTGFINGGNGGTIVYIAIRRGPMRTPTVGTSVFSPLAVTASTGTARTTGFPVDLSMAKTRSISFDNLVTDRLRGYVNNTSSFPPTLITSSTAAESTSNQPASYAFDNTGYLDGQALTGGITSVYWNFRRAPGFFDVVCYTGTGVARTVNHNLGVAPELMMVKARSETRSWLGYSPYTPFGIDSYLSLNDSAASSSGWSSLWNNTLPTSTVFSLGTPIQTNNSGITYVAYLFASVPGVSRVGSYTGNGSSQTIDCGFTTGARFFLVKRTDATGDWWVWDSARGIVAANDPALALNSTAAEVTGTDSVDPTSVGIIVNQNATTNINVNGGTYIYLAIA